MGAKFGTFLRFLSEGGRSGTWGGGQGGCCVLQIDSLHNVVPAGSLTRGGDVMAYVLNNNNNNNNNKLLRFPTLFYSVLVSVSVFMALSTVLHSINSPDNSLLSHSVLLVLFLSYWSCQLNISQI